MENVLHTKSNPYLVTSVHMDGPKPAEGSENPAEDSLIRRHTAASFVVEQRHVQRVSLCSTDWGPSRSINVPHTTRFKFELRPGTSSYPELTVTLSCQVDPTFKHSREFEELDAADQSIIASGDAERTFSSIARVRVRQDKRHMDSGHFELVEVQHRGSESVEVVHKTPHWSRVYRRWWWEVRDKLDSMFQMELPVC